MTDSNYTHLLLIADRSGSMGSIADDMNGGIRQLLQEQDQLDGKFLVDVVLFDNEVEHTHKDALALDVIYPVIVPRGSTALYDAVGKGVVAVGERFAKLSEDKRPGKVIVAVVTDGYENASQEWDKDRVQKLVKAQTDDYGWDFIFLGANIDSSAVGGGLGFTQNVNYQPTASGAHAATRGMSAYVTSSRLGQEATLTVDNS